MIERDQFLTNYTNERFIDRINSCLKECKSFSFSVSFIKKAGLVLIIKSIEQALKRGAIGQLITSTYQNFTDIASLKILLSLMKKYPNFLCFLDSQCFGDSGFHSKGYLFEYDNQYEFIVGSSNITRFALLKNIEWNVSLKSSVSFSSFEAAKEEFEYLKSKTLLLNDELISNYANALNYAIEKWDMDYFDPNLLEIKPNMMQRKALKEIRNFRDQGVERALIVAATGSGKTYLAAFDARNFDAKRLLFIVHRDAILKEAMETFKKVFGANRSYGLFVGDNKEVDCDFIFASNIMIANHLDIFNPEEFDYIVIDECHHSSASSYKKIINYFQPEFLLGLTATPERMDNEDVFELFDYNVPFELRLRDAIMDNLVVPFHYYGIRDNLVNYSLKEKSMISRDIAKTENIDFIIKNINKHLPNDKLKCIAFCNSINHARTMAEAFTEHGIPAIALTGDNDVGERIKAFDNLQNDSNQLQIICTVDILNEGVDIPRLNMVLFLRPTESSTIFLQQLGRGLRKCDGKKYLTVLDFIGNNYDRSVQIAFALGKLSNNNFIEKAYLRDLLNTNFTALNIPGVVINIDELSREEIINYLNKTNFNSNKFLIKEFENFKNYIKTDTYPSHMDYLNNECAPDLIKFLKAKTGTTKNCSYYNFLSKIKVDVPIFTEKQINFINLLSDYLPLTRPDEYIIIEDIFKNGSLDFNRLNGYTSHVSNKSLENARNYLIKEKLMTEDNLLNIGEYNISFEDYLNDLLEYGLTRYSIEFDEFNGNFKLYGNYQKNQIMRILLEDNDFFMKGTKLYDNGEIYCFVGLKKDKRKEERTNYKDKFIDRSTFQRESENGVTINSLIGQKLMNAKTVHLFVRKMDKEDGVTLPFTYFGTGRFQFIKESIVVSKLVGKETENPTLLFNILLDNPVTDEYLLDFEIPDEKEHIV